MVHTWAEGRTWGALEEPNPAGMKNSVLAPADGAVLDIEVYQGSQARGFQVQHSEGSGAGTLVLKRLLKPSLLGQKCIVMGSSPPHKLKITC